MNIQQTGKKIPKTLTERAKRLETECLRLAEAYLAEVYPHTKTFPAMYVKYYSDRAKILHIIAERIIPDEWEYDIKETMSGDAFLIITGHKDGGL